MALLIPIHIALEALRFQEFSAKMPGLLELDLQHLQSIITMPRVSELGYEDDRGHREVTDQLAHSNAEA
jgi:hypothetical protein